jgi:hypothetical protein
MLASWLGRLPRNSVQTLFLLLLVQVVCLSVMVDALPHNSVHSRATRLHHEKRGTDQHASDAAAKDRIKTIRAARALQAQATAPPSSTFDPQPQLIALTPPLASAAARSRRITPMKELKYSTAHRPRQDAWIDTSSWLDGPSMKQVDRSEGLKEHALRSRRSATQKYHHQERQRGHGAGEATGAPRGDIDVREDMGGDKEIAERTLRSKGRKRPALPASSVPEASSTPPAASGDESDQLSARRGL